MINALIQHGEQTAVIELPLDTLSLRYDLSQIGIRTLPKDIPISDDEEQPILVKLYADSDIGSRLAVLFNSRHSLEEANLCAHMVEKAHPAISEDMKSRILNGQYYSPKAVMADITEMTEGLIAVKVDYYCPLTVYMDDDEYGECIEVGNYYARVNEDGIDLTKRFSDGKGDFAKVEFIIHNDTDAYYVKAELDKESGIYYVTDHVDKKADATCFVPVTSGNENGKIIIKGLEDDEYTMHEVRTADGYSLLKKGIQVSISQTETTELCDIYTTDVLGLIQNDPKYAEIIQDTGDLHNSHQKHLEHKLLTASAAVDGNKVSMKEDNASVNALAPLTVMNTKGFNLPETGDHGTVLTTVLGIVAMAGAAAVIVVAIRKKKSV